jgi:tetratricopeptide (TPR) repeat protein
MRSLRFLPSSLVALFISGLLSSSPAQAQAPGTTQFEAGRAAMQGDDFDKAIPAFEAAVRADSMSSLYHLWLGNAYGQKALAGNFFSKMKYGSRMRAEWERAVAIDPANFDAHENLHEFFTQAPAAGGGSAEKAQEQRAIMFRLRPYAAAIYFAAVDTRAHHYQQVIDNIRPILSAYPDSVAPRVALANAQAEAHNFDDAWKTIDAAKARFADNPQFRYAVGRTAAISGMRLEEGKAALQQYLANPPSAKSPQITGAHYRIGMILEKSGDRAAAKTEYETAIRIDPKNVLAKAALEQLSR